MTAAKGGSLCTGTVTLRTAVVSNLTRLTAITEATRNAYSLSYSFKHGITIQQELHHIKS